MTQRGTAKGATFFHTTAERLLPDQWHNPKLHEVSDYVGFRTFRRSHEALPVRVLLERGGSWHNNAAVCVRPAMSFGGVAAQGNILRGFRTWRQVRGMRP